MHLYLATPEFSAAELLLMRPSAFHLCATCGCDADEICEGFDHPEAPPTDLDAAAHQLKLATIQEYQKRLAYKPSRKQSKQAAAAAKQQAGSSSSGRSSNSSSSSSTGSSATAAGTGSSSSSSSSSNEASWQEKLHKLQGMLEDVEDGHQ
jgi:hypothetical protein